MDTSKYRREISYDLPSIPSRHLNGGKPLFVAYNSALVEYNLGQFWVYKALNLETWSVKLLSRRKKKLETTAYESMAKKISMSPVRGGGRFEVDRRFGKRMSIPQLQRLLKTVFCEILPLYGYAVREKQVELATEMLDSIITRRIALAEAEVGTGKTHAYLVASVLAKRGRVNDVGNSGIYGESAYIKLAHMPIVISTSSIALQQAIVKDYIPSLSQILIEQGVIKTPLSVVVRKGKEHYVCEHRLRQHLPFEHDKNQRMILETLALPITSIDLTEVFGLTRHVKSKINVPQRCSTNCPQKEECRYQRHFKKIQSPEIDIQVCNHNYLLADTRHRMLGLRPLIPDYQCLIIDEAHAFLPAVRQMYDVEFSSSSIPKIVEMLEKLTFIDSTTEKIVRKSVNKLCRQNKRLFQGLSLTFEPSEDETERFPANFGDRQSRHLRNIRDITLRISELLVSSANSQKTGDSEESLTTISALNRVVRWLRIVSEQADTLSKHDELIYWLENSAQSEANLHANTEPETILYAIPKDLGERLQNDQWTRNIPIILTSGTLSVSGDFTHTKRKFGLQNIRRISETSKPSPFNYRDNALLYISETMPFPDRDNPKYIVSLTEEIESLIRAAHGHAAVLFTSHDVMGRVFSALQKRELSFPLYKLGRGEVSTIEQFRNSGNGVLFAAGSMWEGVDIPGDALSLLIIVKLPFPVPDPISEHERALYNDMQTYKEEVIIPEMLIKLKQGFGRLIRKETDTGVVAILDSRIQKAQKSLRKIVLSALPVVRVTDCIADIKKFIRAKKATDYFEQGG